MTAKTLSSKPREPWFSKSLLVSRGTKESLYRQACKSNKDPQKWAAFTKYRNLYFRTIRAAKIKHYHTSLLNAKAMDV
jgi:hypothetical protein